MKGWKIFTHDYRSPIQCGAPVWDGSYPHVLPEVDLDTGPEECAAGWNFCRDMQTAAKIAGYWRSGRPSVICEVKADGSAISRGDKCRASSLTLLREASKGEILAAMGAPFGELGAVMAKEQWLWRVAFCREPEDVSLDQSHSNRRSVAALFRERRGE